MNEHEHDLSYDRDFAQLDVHNREHRFTRATPSIPARTRILWAVGWGTAKPPQLWLNLQQTYELRRAENRGGPSDRRDRPAPGYDGAGGL